MGIAILCGAWLALAVAVGSRWLMVLPVALAAGLLIVLEVGDLDQGSGLGRVLVYLGGDYEFWWSTYLIGLPWFLLLIELGYRVRRRLDLLR